VTAVDRLAGLALIRSERSGLLPVTPATGLPPPGSEVLAVGGPGSPLIRALLGGFAPPRKSTTRAAGDVLLLDAAIPVTASGSAVLDSDGHLVAIAEAELAGPGLAIPVQTVTAVVPRLLAADDTPLADLGIRPAPVTRQDSQLLQLGASEGVLAQDVTAGGAAAKAGIRRGDVVTELGGERIATVSDYLRLVAAALPARPIPVTVSRSGETQELTVTPAALKR
jgi:serine protease Do